MAYGHRGWAPYVPVAERRKKAERETAKLRRQGHATAPVVIEGRAIANTFWGKAWCDNLEHYRDYENRLPRGRTYVRNGSVIDLQVKPLEISALVSGSSIYRVAIGIKAVKTPAWHALCRDCSGAVASLVDLLQGRLSQAVMERLCRQDGGLFPTPSEIRFACSCPDGALMCKHVAAVLYGVGARLDQQPDLLFRLRGVDEKDMIGRIDPAAPVLAGVPDAARALVADDLSALFGIEMAEPEAPKSTKPSPTKDDREATGSKSRRPRKSASAETEVPSETAPRKLQSSRRHAPARPSKKPALELTPDGFVKWWK